MLFSIYKKQLCGLNMLSLLGLILTDMIKEQSHKYEIWVEP